MTTVTSLTADRMLAIEAASVVDGDVVGDNLILTKHDGSQINAGSVRGPTGSPGPVGQDLPILTATPVLDVGSSGQIRAGRQLTAADFTAMGLSAPLGLWNLSDLSDVSGNGRNLLNKGVVPFTTGINGSANTAAQFVGSSSQALYIADTGTADPFRIKTGSWGCWFKTAKRVTFQSMLSKFGAQNSWYIGISGAASCTLTSQLSTINTGWQLQISGITDVADDRWHHGVIVYDGSIARLYCDGILEGTGTPTASGPLDVSSSPLNIGGAAADGSTATISPHFGRIDEAFVTADVLSEDQVRNLYCAKIPHTLAVTPSRVSLNVHRRRKGATLAVADFPTQPLRLHNFSGGSLGDEGSNGVGLTNNGSAISVSGVDGSNGNAFNFAAASQSFSATDAGLPSGLNPRSYGLWLKTTMANAFGGVLTWGTIGSGEARLDLNNVNPSTIRSISVDVIQGPVVGDGQWHHIVMTEDNAAIDGVKRKMYIDGLLVGISTAAIASIVLGGANHFRIGANSDGSTPMTGQSDGAFVCGYALTSEQIAKLYAKSLMALASSPKNPGDHVEAMNANSLLAIFDTLELQHTIDLMVA